MADANHIPNTRADGAWIRCADCDSAYWGAFRPTDWIQTKLQAHRRKAHGAPAASQDAAPAKRAKKAQNLNGPVVHVPTTPGLAAEIAALRADDRAEEALEAALADIAADLAAA